MDQVKYRYFFNDFPCNKAGDVVFAPMSVVDPADILLWYKGRFPEMKVTIANSGDKMAVYAGQVVLGVFEIME